MQKLHERGNNKKDKELKMLFNVGRVCVKTAGNEAGKYCVILENQDNNFVLIDGDVIRKRCNMAHLEPLDIVISIKKNSDKQEILDALAKAGLKAGSVKNIKEKKIKAKKEAPVKKKNASKKKQ